MKLIDLSMTISKEMPGVSISTAKTRKADGWNATTLSMYSHSGTHVDAPIHFEAGHMTIDQMPLDSFSADSWIIDCGQPEPSALLGIKALGEVAEKVLPGDGLIFKTGWSRKWGTPEYRNALPRISEELALWMVDKKVKLVGVEPPSVADVNNLSEVTRIHEILLGGNVTICEGLTNLDAVSKEKIWILALPLKIKDGDGCPVRAIAIDLQTI